MCTCLLWRCLIMCTGVYCLMVSPPRARNTRYIFSPSPLFCRALYPVHKRTGVSTDGGSNPLSIPPPARNSRVAGDMDYWSVCMSSVCTLLLCYVLRREFYTGNTVPVVVHLYARFPRPFKPVGLLLALSFRCDRYIPIHTSHTESRRNQRMGTRHPPFFLPWYIIVRF